MTEEEKTEYSQANAARFLKVSPQRVLQWRQRKDLVGFTVGGRWFIKKEELEAFKNKPKRGPGRPRKDGAS